MLSIIILTKNEEDRIKACLESARLLAGENDEIIVIDSESSDKTEEISKKMGAKVFTRKFDNYVNQKNWAFEKISGDWVLYLDADERILEPLKEEILNLIKTDNFGAYAISRRNIILGKEERYGPFWPDWVVRFVKKDKFKTWTGEVHEQIQYEGKLGYTKNSLLHLTHRNVDQMVLKSLAWSNIDANLRFKVNHPPISSWRLLRILFTETINQGIFRRGFFHGTVGTIDALMQIFSLIITYCRLWEMQQKTPLNKVYDEIDDKLIKDNFKYS